MEWFLLLRKSCLLYAGALPLYSHRLHLPPQELVPHSSLSLALALALALARARSLSLSLLAFYRFTPNRHSPHLPHAPTLRSPPHVVNRHRYGSQWHFPPACLHLQSIAMVASTRSVPSPHLPSLPPSPRGATWYPITQIPSKHLVNQCLGYMHVLGGCGATCGACLCGSDDHSSGV